ncbi:EVE domain-containing protein [Glaciecola sp. SC05]|uniref:EVE domain-containing protein n=1 Tax=Glaciecola sp. SC05 TaxID=1987355 RepID=UPI0035271E70
MKHWLFKTEPDDFSIQDLESRPDKREPWNGVRNYQARNFLRDDIKVGDLVFIYHSSCKHVGIAGLAIVHKVGLADPLQFDPSSRYFDAKASPENPRWYMVEIEHLETFQRVLPLAEIKTMPNITDIGLIKKAQRLSVMPVQPSEFTALLNKARA